jgi:DNA polymerase-3 subunit gamma/tau
MAVNVPQALLIYKEIREKGFDSLFFINGLAEHIRNLMVASTPATKCLLETTEDVANQFVVQGAKLSPQFFYRALDLCNKCDLDYRTATNKQLLIELTLIKLCQLFDKSTPLPADGDGGKYTLRKIEPVNRRGSMAQVAPQQAPAASAVTPASVSRPATPVTSVATPVAPTPPPSPAATASSAIPRNPLGIPRILINRKVNATTETKTETSAVHTRNTPIVDERLLAGWQQFIADHPREQIIINTMRCSQPRKIDENHYEIEVENQVQVESFNAHKANIMTFLRNYVENDMLAIDVKINPYIERPKFWTPQEIVASIREYNPYLDKFIDEFDLALG